MAPSVNNKRPASAFLDNSFPLVPKRERRSYSLTTYDAQVVKGWSEILQRDWSSSSLNALYQRSVVREEPIPRFSNLRIDPAEAGPPSLPSPMEAVLVNVQKTPEVYLAGNLVRKGKFIWVYISFRSLEDREEFQKAVFDDLQSSCVFLPSSEDPLLRFGCPQELCHKMIVGIDGHFPGLADYLLAKTTQPRIRS